MTNTIAQNQSDYPNAELGWSNTTSDTNPQDTALSEGRTYNPLVEAIEPIEHLLSSSPTPRRPNRCGPIDPTLSNEDLLRAAEKNPPSDAFLEEHEDRPW